MAPEKSCNASTLHATKQNLRQIKSYRIGYIGIMQMIIATTIFQNALTRGQSSELGFSGRAATCPSTQGGRSTLIKMDVPHWTMLTFHIHHNVRLFHSILTRERQKGKLLIQVYNLWFKQTGNQTQV